MTGLGVVVFCFVLLLFFGFGFSLFCFSSDISFLIDVDSSYYNYSHAFCGFYNIVGCGVLKISVISSSIYTNHHHHHHHH